MGKKSASGGGQRAKEPLGAAPAPPGGPEAVVTRPAPPPYEHGHHPHIEFKFFEELKHRNVVRVAVLYLLACWLILDPVHVVFHMLEVPAWASRLVVVLMAAGLPAALLFAWAFEITPEGLKPTLEVDPKRSIRTLTGRRLDRAIIVVLVLALGYFVADKFWLAKREPVPESVATKPTPPLAPAAIAVPEKSIAVLPFVDMSEKKDQEYFSDGLTEELIDHLSHGADLKVIARTSSFSFKGKNEDVRTIASKLGVAHLLEGSVRKAGNELRVTAQLIRASDGTHLWSQTYDRTLVDIFKVQDEIATTVAHALKVSLLGGFVPNGTGSRSTEAYELFLQAQSMLRHASTAAANEKAVDQMHRAIELDPRFAPAWAQLSNARFNQAQRGFVPGEQVWSDARRAAEKAIALDPKLADGYTYLARIQALHEWDWAGAQTHLAQALVLDPGNAFAISWAGALAQIAGQGDAAREFIEKGVSLDPMLGSRYGDYARFLFYMKRDREALAAIRKLLALIPDDAGWHAFAGIVMTVSGDPAHALAEINNETDEESRQQGRAITYQALGRRNDSDAALAALEEKSADSDPVDIAEVHAFRGEIDQAFAWLDRAIRKRDPYCVFIKTDRLLENLRGDPRYRTLLRKMRLPE